MRGNTGFPGQVLGTSLGIGRRETADVPVKGANCGDRASLPPRLWQSADSTPAAPQALSAKQSGTAVRHCFWLAALSFACLQGWSPSQARQVQLGSLAAEVYTDPAGSGGEK